MPNGQTASALATAKLSGYAGAVAFFTYLNIPQDQIAILGLLMFIDFITGVGKQFRIDRKQITSHAAWLGAVKKMATLVAVLSVAFVLKGVRIEGDGYITGILGILIMAEGYSVLQNVYAIRTGKILPEYDVVSILLRSLGEFLKIRIETAVKNVSQTGQADQKGEEITEPPTN